MGGGEKGSGSFSREAGIGVDLVGHRSGTRRRMGSKNERKGSGTFLSRAGLAKSQLSRTGWTCQLCAVHAARTSRRESSLAAGAPAASSPPRYAASWTQREERGQVHFVSEKGVKRERGQVHFSVWTRFRENGIWSSGPGMSEA